MVVERTVALRTDGHWVAMRPPVAGTQQLAAATVARVIATSAALPAQPTCRMRFKKSLFGALLSKESPVSRP